MTLKISIIFYKTKCTKFYMRQYISVNICLLYTCYVYSVTICIRRIWFEI